MKKSATLTVPVCLALTLSAVMPQARAAAVIPATPFVAQTVTANQRELILSPRFKHLTRVSASLDISSSGYAECGGQYTNYDGYGGTITIVLQQEVDGRWVDYKEWSKDYDTDGAKLFTRGWYVEKGYRYRVVATAELKDGDTVIESGSCDSPIQSYQ